MGIGETLPPISIRNNLDCAYLSENSRIAIDPDTNNLTVQKLVDGLWQPASFETGPNSLWIGRNVGIAAAGHHLLTEDPHGLFHYHTHSDFDGELSLSDAKTLFSYSILIRYESQADDTNEWIGKEFTWVSPSTINGLMKKGYWKTGSLAAIKPIRIRTWHGADENGALEFDQTYPASYFTANGEIETLEDGFIELENGENYYTKISSEADFSLLTNAAETMPWNAIDISLTRYDNLLQTTEWIDGATYTKDDSWFIKNRKIYVCNVTGEQTGTFADNADKWDILGSNHIVYNEVANFALLPDPAEHSSKIYIVLASTGFDWSKRKGLYRSDGIVWTRLSNVQYEVTDAEA